MKKLFFKMDLFLLLLMIVFCVFGGIMILSASSIAAVLRYFVDPNYFFIRQMGFVLLAFVVGFLFVIPWKTENYKKISTLIIVAGGVSLIGLFGYGIIANGARSWYDFGLFNVQPSEFVKSAIIVFMAVYYDRFSKVKKVTFINAAFPLGIGIIMAFLTFLQPDLGGAIIIGAISYFIFISVPIPNKFKRITTLVLFGLAAIFLGLVAITDGKILSEHQMARLEFSDPCDRYLENTGYQVCNGFIAINNGNWFGVGLGNSTQKYLYLPEAHTDFIFPIIVEELGLLFGIFIVFLYFLLLMRVLKIARGATNIRNSILAYGVFLLLLSHIFVNLMGILAVIPLTGVPLPFLSYGGSFAFNIIVMLFVVQRVAIENKEGRENKKLAKL